MVGRGPRLDGLGAQRVLQLEQRLLALLQVLDLHVLELHHLGDELLLLALLLVVIILQFLPRLGVALELPQPELVHHLANLRLLLLHALVHPALLLEVLLVRHLDLLLVQQTAHLRGVAALTLLTSLPRLPFLAPLQLLQSFVLDLSLALFL